jgi:hypothetical protein
VDISPIAVLRELAKAEKRPVRSVNVYDSDVCGDFDFKAVFEGAEPPADRLRYEVRVQVAQRRFSIRANNRYLAIEMRGDFSAGVFSINRPSMFVSFFHGEMVRSTAIDEQPVFVIGGEPAPPILKDKGIQEDIRALRLDFDECLSAYGNGISLYVRPRSGRPLTDILNCLVKLAARLPHGHTRPPSLAGLPDRFRPLISLIRRWGISDDADRTERLEQASRRQLQALVRRVSPSFGAINAYLDGFAGDIPEAAAALGSLAEAAAEARVILDASGSRGA